jgi:DNA-directed RNA polymerase specialized sigma24 family protein
VGDAGRHSSEANSATDWGMVDDAAQFDSPEGRQALNALLSRYVPAMRAHLRFKRRIDQDMAEDLVQGFVSDKILARNLLGYADRKRGRFRNLLLTALDRYAYSALRSRAHKQASQTTSWDEAVQPASAEPVTSDVFDEAWALEVWAEALRRTKSHCAECGRTDLWGVFEARALRPAVEDRPPLAYAELVERYGFLSPVQAANAFNTAKQIFQRILKTVVAEYIKEEDAIVGELSDLKRVLAFSSGTLRALGQGILDPQGG